MNDFETIFVHINHRYSQHYMINGILGIIIEVGFKQLTSFSI